MSILDMNKKDATALLTEREAHARRASTSADALVERIKSAKESGSVVIVSPTPRSGKRAALAKIIPIGATRTPEPDVKTWAERFAAAARQIAIHYGTEQAREHAFLATGLTKIAKLSAPWVELDDDRPRVCEASKGSVGFRL